MILMASSTALREAPALSTISAWESVSRPSPRTTIQRLPTFRHVGVSFLPPPAGLYVGIFRGGGGVSRGVGGGPKRWREPPHPGAGGRAPAAPTLPCSGGSLHPLPWRSKAHADAGG